MIFFACYRFGFRDSLPRLVAPLLLAGALLSGCSPRGGESVTAEQRLDVAEASEASGDLAMARGMYGAAADIANDRAPRLRAAAGLGRVGDPAGAETVLQQILAKSPDDTEVRRRLASIQINNGQSGEAVQNLAMVLAAKPEDDTARIDLGVALDMLGRHAEAQPLYRQALTRAPSDMDAANDLAYSLLLSGQRGAARAVLQPFRSRTDMPERMRATLAAVDGTATSQGPGPEPLYPSRHGNN